MENTFNQNIQKSSDLNSILFPVEKVEHPAIAMGYDVNPVEQFVVQADLGNGKKTILKHTADRYKIVPNAEIYPALEALFATHPSTKNFERTITNIDNLRFNVRYQFPDQKTSIGASGDTVWSALDVGNSYDHGRSLYDMRLVWRKVCSNGMMGWVSTFKVRSRHTKIVSQRIEQIFLNALEGIEQFEEQTAKYEVLASAVRQTNWEERLEEVAKKSGMPKFHDEAKAIVRKEAKDLYGGVVNDFLIYNAINHCIFNDDLNKKAYEVRAETDQKVFNNLVMSI